jgi:hypothetical protein
VLVLEDQRNGDVLGFQTILDDSGVDPFPAAHLVSRGGCGTVDTHRSFLDHAARGATAHVEASGDELVEALAGLF